MIGGAQAFERAVDARREAALLVLAPKDHGAHDRRQRKGDDAGDGDGRGQRERELREQRPGQASLEADRHVDRHEDHGHRDDRSAELAGGRDGRQPRRHAFLQMSVEVLDDDDRVVDDEPDGQNQRQQRQQVDGVTQHQHDEERADQRQRNGYDRDQHRARVAQEQEDDHRDDQQRLDQRLQYLLDGAVDEDRRVVGDLAAYAGRELAGNLRKGVADRLGDVEEIRLRSDLDADEDRALAIEGHRVVVTLRAQFNVGDVGEPHDCTVLLADDQLPEVLDGVHVGGGRQIDADHLALGGTDGRDVVVGRDRVIHIIRGDAVRRHALRVEPGAQRELATADDFRGLYAGQCVEFGLDDPLQVVRQRVVRQRVADKADVHRIGRLADLHGQDRLLRLRRQLVAHRGDLGVDFGQGPVRVVVQAQGRRNRRDARRA